MQKDHFYFISRNTKPISVFGFGSQWLAHLHIRYFARSHLTVLFNLKVMKDSNIR